VLGAIATVIVSAAVFCWWLFPLLLVGWLIWRYARRPRRAPAPLAPPPSEPPAATSGD
jgi:hypothetical protein